MLHSFFFIRMNCIRILRLKSPNNDGNIRLNNGKVEVQENFKYSYKKECKESKQSIMVIEKCKMKLKGCIIHHFVMRTSRKKMRYVKD